MTVYLCGGINALTDSECNDWRTEAKAILRCATLDPMRRDYRGKESESWREIVDGDLVDIAASDCILVNATRPSWGTSMEIVYAWRAQKMIVAFVGQAAVSPWLRFHCDSVVCSLSEACAVVATASSISTD
jgi:hypothetical protein